jgi:pilus assembly protein CpaB
MDRQKLLMIFGLAWISAAVLTWFLYASTKAPKTEKTIRVVAAARDLPAGTRLAKSDLKFVNLAERELPRGAVTAANDVLGKALLYPVGSNEAITAGRLSRLGGAEGLPATIEPGMRAMSVPFTDSSGVSGLIQPRSHVDVLYTRTGSLTEAMTVTLLEDVIVLSIGRTTEVQPPSATAKTGTTVTRSQNQTATLMVTPDQAKKLELAKNQGRISLALRNPLDRSTVADTSPATIETIDPMLLARSGRRPGRVPADVKDAKAWAKLIAEDMAPPKPKEEPKAKEPPKPKHVVDVYRGEKHVQEIFQ